MDRYCEVCEKLIPEGQEVVHPEEGDSYCALCVVSLVGWERDLLRRQLAGAVEALAHDYLDYLREAIYLDDDLLVNLTKRAARNNTDSAGYLRWILTGKSPTADKPQ